MSKELRIRRGTSAAHATFTGANGEITLDTDTHAVVAHNGVTPGGFPLATAAAIAAPTGSGLIGWIRGAVGAVTTTVEKWLGSQSVRVFDFMTDAQKADVRAFTYLLDSTAAIKNAITAAGPNRDVVFPAGGYSHTETLVQPAGQRWCGEGGQRATTIRKMFNGDSINMGTLATLEDINFDANGTLYTGRGIYVPSGFSQRIERVRVANSQGISLEYASMAGGGSHVSDFEANTTNPTVVPAVKMGLDTGPSPKFFDGLWLSGGLFDFSGGGNGSSLSNFYIRNFITSGPIGAGGSALMHIANGRVASGADTTTLSGGDITITGVAFSGPVYLYQAQGIKLVGCSFGSGITEDASTSNSNEYTTGGVYNTTWVQNGGTQPVLGNGSLLTIYRRHGQVCTINFRLVIGSTTTPGNSASGYQFSLPFTGTPDINQRGIFANLQDTSAALDYVSNITIPANTNFFTIGRNGQGARDGVPFVWAVGDTIDAQFTFITR